MSKKQEHSSRYPVWVRILAIALACLTASGGLTYAVLWILDLF